MLDRFGIISSLICSIHCALPLLLIPMGLLGSHEVLHHWAFHLSFLLMAIGFAFFALGRGYRIHGNGQILLMAVTGIILFILGIMLHGPGEYVLVGTAGLLLALSHYWNSKLMGQCNLRHE